MSKCPHLFLDLGEHITHDWPPPLGSRSSLDPETAASSDFASRPLIQVGVGFSVLHVHSKEGPSPNPRPEGVDELRALPRTAGHMVLGEPWWGGGDKGCIRAVRISMV